MTKHQNASRGAANVMRSGLSQYSRHSSDTQYKQDSLVPLAVCAKYAAMVNSLSAVRAKKQHNLKANKPSLACILGKKQEEELQTR